MTPNGQKVSFCTIVRNEAANIVRCLQSVQGIVDEMIVVDTGSTDETARLAEGLGASVSFFAWRDDFAAARNAAVERASGDWIVWLDADEELLAESHVRVPALLDRPEAQAYFVQRQEVEREGQTTGFVEMRQLRLWRSDPQLRFIGRDHPHFGMGLEERTRRTGQATFDSDLRIRHTGYLPQLKKGKLERAARLLQLELEARPDQLYYQIELIRTWNLLGDRRCLTLLEEVLARLLTMASAPEAPTVQVAPLLDTVLLNEPLDSPRLPLLIGLAERWFPDSPPLIVTIGDILFKRGDLEASAQRQRHLIALIESGRYDRSIAFSSHLLGDRPYLNLAVCLHRLGRLEEAERAYRRLLQRSPSHPGAKHNLTILQTTKREI